MYEYTWSICYKEFINKYKVDEYVGIISHPVTKQNITFGRIIYPIYEFYSIQVIVNGYDYATPPEYIVLINNSINIILKMKHNNLIIRK